MDDKNLPFCPIDQARVIMIYLKIRSMLIRTFIRTLKYTDHAGLEIPVDLCITSLFSRWIAIGNAGPTSALEHTQLFAAIS